MFSFNFYLYLLVFYFYLKKYNSYFPLTKHQHTSNEIKQIKSNQPKLNQTKLSNTTSIQIEPKYKI